MIITDPTYEKNIYVKRVDAEFRADIVGEVTYEVSLTLPKGKIKIALY